MIAKYKFLIICLLTSLFACQNQSNQNQSDKSQNETEQQDMAFNENTEIQAIKELINKETESFFNRNLEEWANYWIQEEYTMRAGNGLDGTYVIYGWNKIQEHVEDYEERTYENDEEIKYTDVKRNNFSITFNSNTSAYAKWSQYNYDTNSGMYYLSEESRLLEKEEDGWKFVNVLSFWDKQNPIADLTDIEDEQ